MKKIFPLLMVIPFLSFLCHKDKDDHAVLKGKVIRYSCASYIVQVLNNDQIGEDGWLNIIDQQHYDNVFNALNKCQIPDNIKPGDTIFFMIQDPPPVNNGCYVCFLYDAPPAKQYEVKVLGVEKNH
jgi:hypothetical protein